MKYKAQVQRLVQSYEAKVAWGGGDHEEALHDAVAAAFPGIGDDGQAELYTRIEEQWEGYRNGMVPRKLWIGVIVNDFMSGRVCEAVSGLKVCNNIPVKPDAED